MLDIRKNHGRKITARTRTFVPAVTWRLEDLFYQYVRYPDQQGETFHEAVFISRTKLKTEQANGHSDCGGKLHHWIAAATPELLQFCYEDLNRQLGEGKAGRKTPG